MTMQADQKVGQVSEFPVDLDDIMDGFADMLEFGAAASPPQDRAEMAAASLLRRAVDSHAQKLGQHDLIIIEVPAAEWVQPTSEVALAVLFGWKEVGDGQGGSKRSRHDDSRFRKYECDDHQNKKSHERLGQEVAADLLASKTVIIITCDSNTMLPPSVLKSADHHFALPYMDADWFSEFVSEATGREVVGTWPDISFEDLTPDMLRLATRHGQTAEDYARRLARLTQQAEPKKFTRPLALEDLHGMPAVVNWAKALAVDLREYQAGRLSWNDCDRGALLYGPSGAGKTTAARAIAEYCGIPFFPTSYADWQSHGEGHLGDVTKAIRSTFQRARKTTPSLIFIDELDSVSRRDKATANNEWWRSITNTLLEQLDGVADREGVLVIGATNFREDIDPAIRRAGRLDREIEIGLPDTAALTDIYRVHLGDALEANDLLRLAALSMGRTGADVARWARGARRRARIERRSVIFDDVFKEIAGSLPNAEDPFLRRVAIHEAGHAVVITMQNPGSAPMLSLCSEGRLSGATRFTSDKQSALTATVIDNMLVVLLAGRAAEEIIHGAPSAGAGGSRESDLAKATRLAMQAEASFGLGTTGLIWSDFPDPDRAHAVLAMRGGTETAVRRRLDEAYGEAKMIITEKRHVVERIAEALLARIVLTPGEVADIIAVNPVGA